MNNRGIITLSHHNEKHTAAGVLTAVSRFYFHVGANDTIYAEWDNESDLEARPEFQALARKLRVTRDCLTWDIESFEPEPEPEFTRSAWDEVLEEMAESERREWIESL